MSINELHKLAVKGGREEEENLFHSLSVRLFYLAKRRIMDEGDAKDIVQDALMTIMAEYKKIKFTTSFAAWVFKVLENKILNFQKTGTRRADILARKKSENSPQVLYDSGLEPVLLDCIRKVASTNRQYARIINLYFQGYTTEEICEKLKITPNHSYVTLFRARAMLEKCLAGEDMEND